MKFWDSSAIVPLLVAETTTPQLMELFREQFDRILTWWGSEIECTSAIARLEHEGHLTAHDATRVLHRMDALAGGWHVIEPVESVRRHARRLLRAHRLRAADALQLAAAYVASEGHPASLPFVCLDQRLGIAAQREGFPLLDFGTSA